MNNINNYIKKIELVSPAGGWDQLAAAINAGADAVYLGYKKFGARAYADNFDFKSLKKAVNEAHACGVKIYLTLNTLVKDSELPEIAHFLNEYISLCNDGIIIQDMGIYRIVEELFPGTRVHASTQMNTHNSGSARFLLSEGFARAVLAREMTLSEIKSIADKSEGFELEVFAHGSQCYAYSGNCYFSSFIGNRSGNRGRCSQPCRMKYSFGIIRKKEQANEKDAVPCGTWSSEAFFLSKNDLLTLDIIPEIARVGIRALKIEGRMKSAEYTGIVTSIYRKYIDLYYNQPENFMVDAEDKYKIIQIFSRETSEGYFLNRFPAKIISPGRAGSMGNFLGRVEKADYFGSSGNFGRKPDKANPVKNSGKSAPGRNKNAVSLVVSSRLKINKGDVIGIWTNRGNEEIRITGISVEGEKNKKILYRLNSSASLKVSRGDRVFKLYDSQLDKEARSYFINGISKEMHAAGANRIPVKTIVPEQLRSRNENKERVKDYFSYYQDDHFKEPDSESKTAVKKIYKKSGALNGKAVSVSAEVYSQDCAESLLNSGADKVVLNDFNGIFKETGVDRLSIICRQCKKNDLSLVIKIPEILYDDELQLVKNRLESLVLAGIDSFMVSNTGAFEKLALIAGETDDLKIYLDHSLNIFNHLSLDFFDSFIKNFCKKMVLKGAILSTEMSLDEISLLIRLASLRGMKDFGFSVYSYGFYPVMQSRFKIDYLKKLSGLSEPMKSSSEKYYIRDPKGYTFRVVSGYNENLVYLNSRKICNFFDLPLLLENGVRDIYIDTRTFSPESTSSVISSYKKALKLITGGKTGGFNELCRSLQDSRNFSDYTRGHLFRPLI